MSLLIEQARLRAKATKEIGKAMGSIDEAFRHVLYGGIGRADKRLLMALARIVSARKVLHQWKRIR